MFETPCLFISSLGSAQVNLSLAAGLSLALLARASQWPCWLGPLIGLAGSGLSMPLLARASNWPCWLGPLIGFVKLGPLIGFVKPDRRFSNTGGQVSLNRGVEVTGSYWESLDRILWSNGTIIYKETGVTEEAEIMFGSVGQGGTISLLPKLGEEAVDMDLLRSLNINTN